MTIKAVIFDLDGTLLNTVEDLADASNAALRENGYPEHEVDAYNYFVGDGLNVLMQRAAPTGSSDEAIKKCCDSFNKIYDSCWRNKTRPYKGIEQMLEDLLKENITCTILSNKPHHFTTVCVDHFFREDEFKLVLGQREHINKKPDPAGAIEIMAGLGVDASECLYIGDTSVDMKTGKGAGIYTIGVSWGFRPREELIEHGADLIVNSPSEIVEYVVSSR